MSEDFAKAIELYDQAINKGHVTALVNRAFMHQNGQGGTRDYKAAITLYEQAATQGHPIAMSNRGYMYEHGQGTTEDFQDGAPDIDSALEWYGKAAEIGYAPAMTAKANLLKRKLDE